jgi:undecaprenyl pyrophosphate phosphatase UppP
LVGDQWSPRSHAIKSFLAFVKKRAFSAFGWYRIVLAVVFFFLFVR